MKTTTEVKAWAVALAACLSLWALPATAAPAHAAVKSAALAAGAVPKDCSLLSISCGQTKTGTLASGDCQLNDGSFADFYEFNGTNGQTVTATMTSSDLDSYTILLDPNDNAVAQDDDGAGGHNSRLSFRLNSSGSWAVVANSATAGETGNYTLVLNCSGGTTDDGFLHSPAFPNFRFKVRITDPATGAVINGRMESACLPETLCVSGAVAGRSEVFVRIVGPKPNGFLWPTLVKFTTSAVDIDVNQISTGITKTYHLAGASPGNDVLPGLFDRTGFQP
jgi:hypothetical protein